MNPSMLPMGFTFSPTDEELLSFYLYHKIVGDFIPPIVLPVIDIYTQEPLQIWQQCGGVDGQDVHFFTNLKKKKSRVIRKVGSNGATWSGENKATKVFSSFDGNTLVGSFKRFHYEDSKVKRVDHDHDNNYSWIMYEYTLHPTIVPKEVIHDAFVLCMLRKKILAKEKRALTTIRQTSFCPNWPNTTTQLEVQDDNQNPKRRRVEEQLLNGYNMEEPPQLLFQESDLQPLITDYSVEMELKNQQHPDDVGLVNECPIMQMNPPHGDQYYDPVNTVMWSEGITMGLHEICPTMEMKAPDQNYSIEDEDTLFVKEIETELEQQCNDVAPSYKENDLNYDNEWYWSGSQSSS